MDSTARACGLRDFGLVTYGLNETMSGTRHANYQTERTSMSENQLEATFRRIYIKQKWRRIASFSYVALTAIALCASSGASVLAALEYSKSAAVAAAAATAFFGLEKAMLLREKWAHHALVASRLQSLLIRVRLQQIDGKLAGSEIDAILLDYSSKLPITAQRSD